MKRFIIFIFLIMPIMANAIVDPDGAGTTETVGTLTTTCPYGHQQVSEPLLIITDNTSCPSGYTSIGENETCLLDSIGGVCVMYAPAEQKWGDSSGVYEFKGACAMTE
ncbi:MAG: hypothetical protein J6L70_03060 [Alphaproteobacteria bacterium]|nr:hypothetical protein [Alphaproteobacteria bacterium]